MFGLFRNRQRERIVSRLYDEILAQARNPALFLDHGVPDTVEGRLDMMILHVFLFVHRMRGEDVAAKDAAQELCDRFFTETDRALREMGVGDLAVPKRMKKIGEVYAGCASTYAAALGQPGEVALAAALARNVYGDAADREPRAAALADYVRRAATLLAGVPALDLVEKGILFPSPRHESADGHAASA